MKKLEEQLKECIEGEVHFDSMTRHIYSVDASIFEVVPKAIVIPKTKQDLINAIQLIHSYHIPVTVRGAATGITGGCLGRDFIIDTSKYLHHILEINIEQGYAICEPGVIQDDLNRALAPYGYRLGPDTSTGNRATLGGMLANNAAGARSLRYGKMVDHIQSVEMILSHGEVVYFQPISETEWFEKQNMPTREGEIYRTIYHIKKTYQDEIEKRFPKIPRRVSGYNLDELIKNDTLNVSKLIAGSEGTLGIITEMKVHIVPKAQYTGLCLIHFNHMIEGMQQIPYLLSYNPLALEMIDDQIIELGRASPSLRGQMDWLHGKPQALFIVELEGKNNEDLQQKIAFFSQRIKQEKMGYAHTVLTDPKQMNKVWTLRKAGLGILLSKRTYSRAIAFIEDITVAPDRLAPFMEKFCAYLQSKGKWAGIYGHVGSGCLHIRPYMNLQNPNEYALMHQMMLDISDLLLDYGGALSGEHGDGLIRSWLNPKMFGENIIQAFIELKKAFDPDNLMNPGKIVSAPSFPSEGLRLSPGEELKKPTTFLNFQREGGFELAVDLCNGNGLCRKKETIMCPSFQVTNEEFHSTRARAQALRSIIHGRLPMKDLTSQDMYKVMELCISCKGCKTECPSQVDMAKMKAEFLYHYQEQHGYSFRSYLFAYIGYLNQWLSPFAKLFNFFNQTTLAKKLLSLMGITPKRTLPSLAQQRFSSWFKNYEQPLKNKTVVLFNDTFNEFNEPQIGQAAVKILNQLGYKVIVPPWQCCGRPTISKGFLKQAKKQINQLKNTLMPYIQDHIPIIGLEPSCILTIKDDYQDFTSTDEDSSFIHMLSKYCLTLDEFLAKEIEQGSFKLNFKYPEKETHLQVHGHCHQKALVGMLPTLKVLQAIPGFKVSLIEDGCCGMAGSFGYEKEHYDISMQIGELRLFPTIRKSQMDGLLVADGTSCRHQIKDGTNRKAIHLAEAIAAQLNNE